MPAMEKQNGWSEWSKFVLKELERLHDKAEQIDDRLALIHTDIAMLKIKASLFGVIGGAIPVVVMLGIKFLSN